MRPHVSTISKKILLICIFAHLHICLSAQLFIKKVYPQNYFQWPVNAKIGLAANFGELRPNHYHMGLDCRTDQRENRPVLAAADGYIAKVKIEPFGFGRCIYINHPNGLTTLYAHLNDFYPELEKYITAQQYLLQSWSVFLDIPIGLLPVKKGQFIAFSGNTGGSQGPHMHFEIRDTKTDKVLNPLLFGLPVTDNIAPDVLRLALYDRNISTYEQGPRFYPVKKVGGKYTTAPDLVLTNSNKVSFGITAYDRYTGSTNRNGIYEAALYDNGQAVVGFQLDSISYDETRYLNAHIDYRLKSAGGNYVQHLSQLPGYPKGIYKHGDGDGVIYLPDDSIHEISIIIKDAAGNTSRVEFKLKRNMAIAPAVNNAGYAPFAATEFQPGFVNVFENNNVRFFLAENQVYDSFRFRYNEIIPAKGYTIYQLHNGYVPVHSMFAVNIKNTATTNPDKMVMHRSWGGKDDYSKAINQYPWFTSIFRAFGNFQLQEDTLPPIIIPVGFKEGMNTAKLSRLAFIVKDNTEELENFRAELDGKWLRFSNDKGRTFIYKFDERCPPGLHELKISVEDCVGNRTEKTYHFTR
ncbi:MAG: M23 family metallopeptidase [Ferruginibacter sp.]